MADAHSRVFGGSGIRLMESRSLKMEVPPLPMSAPGRGPCSAAKGAIPGVLLGYRLLPAEQAQSTNTCLVMAVSTSSYPLALGVSRTVTSHEAVAGSEWQVFTSDQRWLAVNCWRLADNCGPKGQSVAKKKVRFLQNRPDTYIGKGEGCRVRAFMQNQPPCPQHNIGA